jgi:hypothetical protein
MQPQNLDWPTAVVEIAKYFVPAAITALVSILISRYQWKTKEIEISGQAEIKARELLFDSYQKRIERIGNFGRDMGEAMGKLLPYLQDWGKTETGNDQIAIVFLEIIKIAIGTHRSSLIELEEELKKVGLLQAKQGDVTFVKNFLSVDPNLLTAQQFGPVFLNFIKTLSIMDGLQQDLLHKKSQDLFEAYLGNSQKGNK